MENRKLLFMIKKYKAFSPNIIPTNKIGNKNIVYQNMIPIIGKPSGEYIEITQEQFKILQELYLVKYDIILKSMIFDDNDYNIIMINIDDKKQKIQNFLKDINVFNYKINKDYTVDSLQSVKIDIPLKTLPIQFDYVLGDFDISNCGLYSLKGCPDVISGDFICSSNILENLKFGPSDVTGKYDVRNCGLRNLYGSPRIINGDFICSYNSLENLEGGPSTVNGSYLVDNCLLDSIKGSPKIIKGDFICSFNYLKNLKGGPSSVNGIYDCSNNDIDNLKDGPAYASIFKCNGNKRLKDLSDSPKTNKIISDDI